MTQISAENTGVRPFDRLRAGLHITLYDTPQTQAQPQHPKPCLQSQDLRKAFHYVSLLASLIEARIGSR